MKQVTTILGELLKIFPRYEFEKLEVQHQGNPYTKYYTGWQQLVTLLLAQIGDHDSLRGIETSLGVHSQKWYHLGLKNIKRSTLSDAMKNRPHEIHEGLFYKLLSMVLDNNDADVRHGVQPTYKKKKGFHPVQMNWGRYTVDAVFRGGSKHCNHGNTVENMIRHMVAKIHNEYRKDVPIIIRMDSGYFDEKLLLAGEDVHIGYICGARKLGNIAAGVQAATEWSRFKAENKQTAWEYTEFMSRQKSWGKKGPECRRFIYSRQTEQDGQLILPGVGVENVIVTNLGVGEEIDKLLKDAGHADLLEAGGILANYHKRGNDELANRALKDFGNEQLPFKDFHANTAWYYLMLLANNLLEAFKEDVTEPVIPTKVYAQTFRRQFLDVAGKIVRHAGKTVMKVSNATMERLQLDTLFVKSQTTFPSLC